MFDAQANFFNTFTRPFFDAGNRFLEPFQDVGSQFGAGQLSFGEAGQNLFSQQGELASQAFQPFAETGNNLFELGGLEFDFRNPFGIRRQSQAKKLKAKVTNSIFSMLKFLTIHEFSQVEKSTFQ